MTPEELEAKVSDQAEQIEKLLEKNRELIAEKRKLKGSDGADAQKLFDLENENQELKQNLERLQRTSQLELQKAISERDALLSNHNKLLKTNGLTSALDAVKVRPELRKAVLAMFDSQIEIKDGELLTGGKPLHDAVKEWASSDEGKHYIAAPANNGGGANGSGSNSAPTKKFAEMNLDERTQLFKTDPAAYAQLKAAT